MLKNRWWILSIGWILIIFTMSMMSGEQSGQLSNGLLAIIIQLIRNLGIELTFNGLWLRKLAHFLEFTILGFLLSKSTNQRLVVILLGIMVIISDESLQSMIPGRVMAFSDMLIDFSGFSLAVVIMHDKNKHH
jgi:VanZ family protein